MKKAISVFLIFLFLMIKIDQSFATNSHPLSPSRATTPTTSTIQDHHFVTQSHDEDLLWNDYRNRSPSPTLDARKYGKKRIHDSIELEKEKASSSSSNKRLHSNDSMPYLKKYVNSQPIYKKGIPNIQISESERQTIERIRKEKPKEFQKLITKVGKEKYGINKTALLNISQDLSHSEEEKRESTPENENYLEKQRRKHRNYMKSLRQPGNEKKLKHFKIGTQKRNQKYYDKIKQQTEKGTLPIHLQISKQRKIDKERMRRKQRKQQQEQQAQEQGF